MGSVHRTTTVIACPASAHCSWEMREMEDPGTRELRLTTREEPGSSPGNQLFGDQAGGVIFPAVAVTIGITICLLAKRYGCRQRDTGGRGVCSDRAIAIASRILCYATAGVVFPTPPVAIRI